MKNLNIMRVTTLQIAEEMRQGHCSYCNEEQLL